MPFCFTTLSRSIFLKSFPLYSQRGLYLRPRVLSLLSHEIYLLSRSSFCVGTDVYLGHSSHGYHYFPFIVVISFFSLSHLSDILVGDVSEWDGNSPVGRTVSPNPGNNSPCWDPPTPKLPFTFSLHTNRLAQCEETRIYWKAD